MSTNNDSYFMARLRQTAAEETPGPQKHFDSSARRAQGGFFQSRIIAEKLFTRLVPFLPLSRHHVNRCTRRELCQRGECQRKDIVEAVENSLTYTLGKYHFFSNTGCKMVPAKVNLFL